MKKLIHVFFGLLLAVLPLAAQEIDNGAPVYVVEIINGVPYLSGAGGGGGTPVDLTPYLKKDGTIAYTADQNGGGFGITNLGALIPFGSNTVNLGSLLHPWGSIYASGHTIYLDGIPMLSVSNSQLVVAYPVASSNGTTYTTTVDLSGLSNQVAAIEARTNAWNTGSAEGNYASNWIGTYGPVLASTSYVDNAVSGYAPTSSINGVSGRVSAIESKTNDWNTAYGWGNHAVAGYAGTGSVNAVSARVGTIESKTNDWNAVYSWMQSNSNGLSFVFSQTNSWTVGASAGNYASNWIAVWSPTLASTNFVTDLLTGYASTSTVNAVSSRVGTIEGQTNAWNTATAYVAAKSNNWDTAYNHLSTLFAGSGTTGNVTSATANTNQYLRGDGTWQTVAASGAGDVFKGSNNTYSAGTTQSMPYAIINNGLEVYGNTIHTNCGVSLGSTDTTKAKFYVNGESGAYTNKPLVWFNRSAAATGPILQWGTNGVLLGSIDVNGSVSVPSIGISNNLTLGGVTVSSFSTNTPIFADGSQPFNATMNAGTFGVTNLGTLLPFGSNTCDLGSAALPWRNAYYVSHTIYMGGWPISVDDGTGKLLVPGVQYSAPQYTIKSVAASDMMLRGAATDPAWDGLKVRMTFSGTNLNGVSFICDLPQYSPETDIVPLILWEGNDVNVSNVIWQMDYIWRNIGDISTYGDWTTLAVTNVNPALKWQSKVSRFPTVSGAGKNKNSVIQIRLQRRGDLDDNNDTVSLLFFGLRYAIQATGEDAQ